MINKIDRIVGQFTKTIDKLAAESGRLFAISNEQAITADKLLAYSAANAAESERASRIADKLGALIND